MRQDSAWDLTVLNSGLFGSVIGVIGAFAISVLVMLYSLWRTEKANRTVAFESAMLKSAEVLAAALVRLRYRLDPVFADNHQHVLALSPEDVVAWTTVARAHASALAVDDRPYRDAAKRLTEEILLFTAAVKSAAGRDAETRLDAYGWPYQSDEFYDTFLQAADATLASWADSILAGLADLRRGVEPEFKRPTELELVASEQSGSKPLETPEAFASGVTWFPMSHLAEDAIECAQRGELRPAPVPNPF